MPVKSADQQAALRVHRVRQGVVRDRTAWINRLRGLLSEFGIIMPKGRYSAQAAIPAILGDEENGLPSLAREMIHDLWLCIQQANDQILSYDRAPSYLRAVVALAARNARLIWTLMMKQENYRPIMTN